MSTRHIRPKPKNDGKEVEVTWEDQKKINTFGRLNAVATEYRAELSFLKEEIQKCADASDEIYVTDNVKFTVGETYIDVDESLAEDLINNHEAKYKEKIDNLESQLSSIENKMDSLKSELYARFGQNNINLDP
mmetsp:Transcript_4931/g.7309  ORF Transcript_4931/g.7309 Transcript_4931/m.7309 type:complete len:133 (+) Transcript_4931:53-451(+)